MSGGAGEGLSRVFACSGSKLLYNYSSVSRLRGFERCDADVAAELSGERGLAVVGVHGEGDAWHQ